MHIICLSSMVKWESIRWYSDGNVWCKLSPTNKYSIEKLSFQCYVSKHRQFKCSYLKTFEFFQKIPKKMTPVKFKPSTSRSLVWCFILCVTQELDVTCKWFLCKTKQQEPDIHEIKFLINFVHGGFSADFSMWFLSDVCFFLVSELSWSSKPK